MRIQHAHTEMIIFILRAEYTQLAYFNWSTKEEDTHYHAHSFVRPQRNKQRETKHLCPQTGLHTGMCVRMHTLHPHTRSLSMTSAHPGLLGLQSVLMAEIRQESHWLAGNLVTRGAMDPPIYDLPLLLTSLLHHWCHKQCAHKITFEIYTPH